MAYLTAAELSKRDAAFTKNQITDAEIDDLVAEFEQIAEDYRGVAFVARTTTEAIVITESTTWLRLRWPEITDLTSVTVTSPAVGGTATAIDLDDVYLDSKAGDVQYPAGFSAGDLVTVAYDHGLATIPSAIVRACRQYVRSCALRDRSNSPREVIAQGGTDVGGFVRFSTPNIDEGRPTGYLEVDRLLNSVPDRRRIL